MEAIQDILFFGGMNSDDALEMMPQGDYLYLENATNFDEEGGNNVQGKVSKLKGNTLVVNNHIMQDYVYNDESFTPTLLSSEVKGTVKDNPNNEVYIFIYETYSIPLTSGTITKSYRVCYRYDNDVERIISCVFRTQLAVFDIDLKVKWGNVLNGELFWTQETIEPKSINIEKAENYILNSRSQEIRTPAYSTMNMQEFNVVRVPPIIPLSLRYFKDEDDDYTKNTLANKLFQFRQKFVYKDNSESVWGSISQVALPYGEIKSDGTFDDDNRYNAIKIGYRKPNDEIKEIWFASRYVDSDGIMTDFGVFEKLNVEEAQREDSYIVFYNDILGEALSDEDNTKILDVVPLSAATQNVVSNPDRICYGNIEEPIRDNITTNVTVSVVRRSIDIQESSSVEYTEQSLGSVVFTENALAPYRIAGRFVYCNGLGIATTLSFNNDWILNPSASTIRIIFTASIDNVLKIFSTTVDIHELSGVDVYQAIIDRIHTDAGISIGTDEPIAYLEVDDFNSYMDIGDSDNQDKSKWIVDSTYAFRGDDNYEASYRIYIRTGKLLQIENSEISYCTTSNEISGVHFWSVKRTIGLHIARLYLLGTLSDYNQESSSIYTTVGVRNIRSTGVIGGTYVKTIFTRPSVTHQLESNSETIGDLGQSLSPSLDPFGRYGTGIVYLDENYRPGYVQKTGNIQLERTAYGEEFDSATIYNIKLSISHYAPSWAKYWMPVMTKNQNMATFTEVDLSIDTGTPIHSDADYIYIDVNTSIFKWDDKFKTTGDVYQPYKYNSGDRVIIYDTIVNKYYDKEIISVNDDGKIMIQKSDLIADNIHTTVRFYSPQVRLVEDFYFEMGLIYEVKGHRTIFVDGVETPLYIHSSNTANQGSTTPLEIILPFGDIYLNAINYYSSYTGLGELRVPTYNEFFVPFYQSKINSFGRSHSATSKIKTDRYKSRLRISNALIQDSNTNGLHTFSSDSTSKMDIPEKHGQIQGIIELGYTLKVITETKLMSIYVNRTVTVDPNGDEGVLLVNKALGTLKIPAQSYGTKYPNSITEANRSMYFIDTHNRCIVRDSANGQVQVSDYKYMSYVRRLCDALKQNPDSVEMFSLFKNNEFGFAVRILDDEFTMPDSRANVLVFNELKNRWTHHVDTISDTGEYPEWGEGIGDNQLFFLNGQCYLQESNENRGEMFGEDHEALIEFVFNDKPKQNKLLNNTSVHATTVWSAYQNNDISIPPSTSYPNGMSSRIRAARFRTREGKFYAPFASNGYTPNMTYDNGVVKGQKLRGALAVIKLRNSDKTASDLFSVSIKYNISETSY